MDAELVLLRVKIFSDEHTLLSYKDGAGVNHTNSDNLTVEQVVDIFKRAKRPENIPRLERGIGSANRTAGCYLG
jgi:hypothetical protein